MSVVFFFSFLALLFYSCYMDWKTLKSAKRSIKWMYYTISAAAFGLFVSKFLHIQIPLPTQFFIQTVSPWISRIVGM
jgi:hypothetical protein